MKNFKQGINVGSIYFTLTFVFLLFINIASYFMLEFSNRENPILKKYSLTQLKQSYPDVSDETLRNILDETWGSPVMYESYVQFREPEKTGSHVNVSPLGFRKNYPSDTKSLPINHNHFNLFVFGGSTVFGYGVRDNETIPAHLEQLLNNDNIEANVYNFGRAFYFSVQERILFEKLISAGNIPDAAIFIDGLNEFYHPDGNPTFTGLLAGTMDYSFYSAQKRFFRELPAINLIRMYRDQWFKKPNATPVGRIDEITPDNSIVEQVLRQYLSSARISKAVSKEFDISVFFVWQPAPEYGMDLTTHPFYEIDNDNLQIAANRKKGYEIAGQLFESDLPEIIWAADLDRNCLGNFVDMVHYSTKFNRIIAEMVHSRIIETIRMKHPPAKKAAPCPASTATQVAAAFNKSPQ